METIIVVGGGQAAAALIVRLRALGHAGRILLVGDEPHLPYQRPPLSKKYLAGELPRDRLLLRQAAWYAKNAVELYLEATATAIDRAAKEVHLADGRRLAYDRLALTTGARARRLPARIGGDLAGVFLMRDLGDADALAVEMLPGRRVLVVGGGYIGLEAAAEAAKKGLAVTLVEMAERILQRVACRETADYFRALHRGYGVDLREGVGLVRLAPGAASGIEAALGDGTVLSLDLVIVGVGIEPRCELAAAAGLAVELGGIAVDAHGRTDDPAIFAAGDCTAFRLNGRWIRLESVQNANDQAAAVAANLLGADEPYRPEPWFWSDQYDVKLQIAGLHHGYREVVCRPGPKPGSRAHFYYDGNRLLAVDAMNDPVSYTIARKLLAAGRPLPQAAAADPAFDLRSLLAAG